MALNKSQLLSLFARLNFHPSRKLGQNFLIDPNLLDFIVKMAAPAAGQRIVEVGPGAGTLTDKLLASGAYVIAVEYDHRLCAHLRDAIKSDNLELVEADACDVDYAAITAGGPFRVVSNLPYAISTPLTATLATLDAPPTDLLLLLQKETADRFASPPRRKEYGWLSVLLQNVYDIERLRNVPPDVFFPKPEIDSALLRLTRKAVIPSPCERRSLRSLTSLAFSNRRKKMLKNLAAMYDAEALKLAFDEIGGCLEARAEELTPEQFLRLARLLRAQALSGQESPPSQFPACP